MRAATAAPGRDPTPGTGSRDGGRVLRDSSTDDVDNGRPRGGGCSGHGCGEGASLRHVGRLRPESPWGVYRR